MASPLVSIISLCHNHEAHIDRYVEGIEAQTMRDFEVIVVDDASSDGSAGALERWARRSGIPIALDVHRVNRGVCASTNAALGRARGTYVAFCSTDDVWLPDKLERQTGHLEALGERVGVSFSDAWLIDEAGVRGPLTYLEQQGMARAGAPSGRVFADLVQGCFIPVPTAMVRRSCYETVGPYDESLPYEDWDMWLRMSRHTEFTCTPYIDVEHRMHGGSLFGRTRHTDGWYATEIELLRRSYGVDPSADRWIRARVHDRAMVLWARGSDAAADALKTDLRLSKSPKAALAYAAARVGAKHSTIRRLAGPARRVLATSSDRVRRSRPGM